MSAIYHSRVMHLRRMPDGKRIHQFRYKVFRLLLDIDRLDETISNLRIFSRNRLNLISFHDRDYGPRNGTDLRSWADALLAKHSVERPEKLMFYTFPRVLGYAFNPLSAWFAYNEHQELSAVIYEVRNTDGDMIHYTFPLNGNKSQYRHEIVKAFYVSPFIDDAQRYEFTLSIQDDTLNMRIRVDAPNGLTMVATENGTHHPLTNRSLWGAVIAMPLMTFKIIVGIYWEAVRLRLKGADFFRHPGNEGRYVNKT